MFLYLQNTIVSNNEPDQDIITDNNTPTSDDDDANHDDRIITVRLHLISVKIP